MVSNNGLYICVFCLFFVFPWGVFLLGCFVCLDFLMVDEILRDLVPFILDCRPIHIRKSIWAITVDADA